MRKIKITLSGKKYEQKFFEINDNNSPLIQDWITSGKTKLEIDPLASEFPLLHTIQFFDTDKSWITVTEDDKLINIEPYPASDDCFFNLIYGSIDSSTYNEPISIDLSCRAITTNPEQWYFEAQRVFDCCQDETFLSPLNSIVLQSMKDSSLSDKEYMVKTTTSFSVYEYEFKIAGQFEIDNLCFFIDPNPNFYTYTECIMPDFLLYNDVFRCGQEIYSMPIKLDLAKGMVKKTIDVVAEYQFDEKRCDTLSTVLF